MYQNRPMAASEDGKSRYQDVEFTRTTSTRQWGRDLNPHASQSRRKQDFPSSAGPSPHHNHHNHTSRVIRTGGITGTLPSHSTLPPTSSPATSSAPQQPPAPSTPAALQTSPPPPSRAPRLTQVVEKQQAPPTSQPRKDEVLQRDKKPLPSNDVLDALFDRLTKRMKLPPERVAQLNSRTPEHKWSMILAQNEIQAGVACVFYIEQLVRHAQPELKEKRPKKRFLANLQPLSTVLTDLEVDLKTNLNDSWVKDFISTPNHGHVALIDLIKDLADTPNSIQRRNTRKYTILERDPNCLNMALLCLKALMGHRKGFGAILKYDPSLCVLAYCLDSQNTKIKILILKIMVTVLLAPGGHRKVMQAFDYFRAIMKERTRFQLLMSSLIQEPVDPAYQASVLCFVNTVVQVTKGPNAKVFHQHEFMEAGFNPDEVEKSLHGRIDERIMHEIKEWRKNFISVQSYMDDLVVCRGKVRNIQEELEETKLHLKEANSDRESLYEQTKSWIEKTENQRLRIVKMNEEMINLFEVKKERDSLLQEKQQLLEAKQKYRTRTSELKERVQTLMEENKALLNREILVQEQIDSLNKFQKMVPVPADPEPPPPSSSSDTPPTAQTPDAPVPMEGEVFIPPTPPPDVPLATEESLFVPPPPPLPPPPPPLTEDGPFIPPPPPIPFGIPVPPPPPIGGQAGLSGSPAKKPVVPNVPLPMLNWLPIKNPEHTIFKDLNDENIIETVDFSEFERLFQVRKSKRKETNLTDQNHRKVSQQLTLIENRRSRNLSIAMRRIGQSPVSIGEAVSYTDLDSLSCEHCELLLKFIPTKEELEQIAKHRGQYELFGEAEKFMYHVAKVERYEFKLECMAYMGNFDDLLNATQPQIDAVLSASLSVLRSSRLKKVFEIILAFGNYMNSSRRGAVYGFKLESLSKITDTRSHDKKQTLLNYIVHVVEKVFPNVLTFHEDLDITTACSVSLTMVMEDVASLKQGLKVLQNEMEIDSSNFIIFSFHKHASKKMEHLNATFAKMEDAYREICLMFSENPKTTDPSDFFGTFAKFTKQWKESVKKNRDSKKHKMASTQDLLKKQEEEEEQRKPSMTMAMLAAEAAAEAATRSEKIRRRVLENDLERDVQSDDGEERRRRRGKRGGGLREDQHGSGEIMVGVSHQDASNEVNGVPLASHNDHDNHPRTTPPSTHDQTGSHSPPQPDMPRPLHKAPPTHSPTPNGDYYTNLVRTSTN